MARTLVLAVMIVMAAVVANAVEPARAQVPGSVQFESDTRIARIGNPVILKVTGLASCGGELVDLGFFGPGFSGDLWNQSRVDSLGTASVQLLPSQALSYRAGVRGDCLEGPIEGDVVLHVVDPVPAISPSEPVRERGLDFFWGDETYRYPTVLVGHLMTLEVTGLEQCAGREVEVGFFAGLWGQDTYTTATIGEDGSAIVELRPLVSAADQRAGAIGSCLGGGFDLSGRAFYAFERPADGEPFALVVPRTVLDAPVTQADQDEYATVAELFDHLVIYADGQECGTLSLVKPEVIDRNGGALFELGVGGQHPYCSNPMALVTLVDRFGRTLHQKWTVDPAETVVVDNLEPEPPHGPPTRVLIPVFLARYEGVAERMGHITVLADGQVCGTISLTEPEQVDQQGNLLLPLGLAGQPQACSREGATIYFKDRNGTTLLATFTLAAGETYLLRNFAPPPPIGPGPPGPPHAGTGLASGAGNRLMVVGIALVSLGLAGALLAARRRGHGA